MYTDTYLCIYRCMRPRILVTTKNGEIVRDCEESGAERSTICVLWRTKEFIQRLKLYMNIICMIDESAPLRSGTFHTKQRFHFELEQVKLWTKLTKQGTGMSPFFLGL